MGEDRDEDTGVMLIMIIVMEVMINAMTLSLLPVLLSALLISHPFIFCSCLSCEGSQEGWSLSQHALGEK